MPSGPQFQQVFNGNFMFNTRSAMDTIHQPLTHDKGKIVFFQVPDKSYVEAKVISSPLDDEKEPYTIQTVDKGDIHEFMSDKLLKSNPTVEPTNPTPSTNSPILPLLPWIQHDVKVTLWLPSQMQHPKQGRLKYTETTDKWSFSPGKKDNHPHIPLPNFLEIAQSMVTNKKLFNAWKSKKTVLSARNVRAMSNLVARHVSATALNVLDAPSLLRHGHLSSNDRKLWDKAFNEEYDGLCQLNTWDV